jgi:hypothetical protein
MNIRVIESDSITKCDCDGLSHLNHHKKNHILSRNHYTTGAVFELDKYLCPPIEPQRFNHY